MPFDWAEYLVLANELAARTSEEAALRSAVSRAYYAAFCVARNHLLQAGVRLPNTGEAHKQVWLKYRHDADRRRKSVGTQGDRLKRLRTRADYHDKFVNLSVEVRGATASATAVLNLLNALNPGTP